MPTDYSRTMIGRAAALSASLLAVLVTAPFVMAGDSHLKQPVLVELYTSQGCSDCPLADDILADLARRSDVIALSFPITYWDMLGWRDTLASIGNTDRQNAYAEAMGRGGTYTPQMIVDGVEDVIGNKRHSVLSAITRHYAQRREAAPIFLSAAFADSALNIAIAGDAPGNTGSATVWVMPVLSHAEVAVESGENANRMLSYTNVVRDIRHAGSWNGGESALRIPLGLDRTDYDAVAVILQNAEYGEVLAAALVRREQ